jgi:FkbM family methyltransferase
MIKKIFRIAQNPRRLWWAVLTRFSRWTDLPIRVNVKLCTGRKMRVVLPDTLSTVVAYEGDYESEVAAYLREVLKPGDIFFDVGAHFGLRSLQAIDITGGNVKVVAFEPGIKQLETLGFNCSDLHQVAIVPKAVSNVSGKKLSMKVFKDRFIGSSTLERPRLSGSNLRKAMKQMRRQVVDTIKLDDFSRDTGVIPSVIKIDVENHEMRVLQGARGILRRYHPSIIIEIGDINRDRAISTESCLGFLKKFGYKFKVWNGKKLVDYQASAKNENVLAIVP